MKRLKELKENYVFDAENGVWVGKNASAFHYSDGDAVENHIRETLNTVTDRSVGSDELKEKQVDWATTYYFSGNRSNILRPFEKTLLKNARVLELGCGMGAVTRYLGETAKEILAVEGSARRGSAAALRCADLPNVEVIIDDIMALPETLGKFDVVTLIGVLEYAGRYGGKGAEEELLRKAASFLKPDGRLILALENKLGLKYLGGVPEDHLGARWVGVTNGYAENGVRTWSRKELARKLEKAGFGHCEQYLALPDYKLPITVVTPLGLEQAEDDFNLAAILANSRRQYEEAARFNMGEAWRSVAQAGLVGDLADSLCFVAGFKPEQNFEKDVLVHHYGGSFALGNKFAKELRIEKADGKIVTRRRKLDNFQNGAEEKISQKLEDEPYYPGMLMSDLIRNTLMRPNWSMDDLFRTLMPWILALKKNMDADGNCPGNLLDYMPFNLVLHEGKWVAFDQEWVSAEPVPFLFLVYRGLRHTFARIWPLAKTTRHNAQNFTDIFNEFVKFLHVPETWPTSADYWRWQEQKFLGKIHSHANYRMSKDFPLLYMNSFNDKSLGAK